MNTFIKTKFPRCHSFMLCVTKSDLFNDAMKMLEKLENGHCLLHVYYNAHTASVMQ